MLWIADDVERTGTDDFSPVCEGSLERRHHNPMLGWWTKEPAHVSSPISILRMMNFWILPDGVIGSSETNRTRAGTL